MFLYNFEKKGPMIQICICSFVVQYVFIPHNVNKKENFFWEENTVSTDRCIYIFLVSACITEGRAGITTLVRKRGSKIELYNTMYHTKAYTVIVIMFGEFLCTYIVALMFRFTHTFC